MSSETELIAEMREDERERRARVSAPGDGLIRKALGDALPRTAEPVPELLKLFGDHRDKQLVDALGAVISITRRQMRKELAEELAERDPQLRKIVALELEVAKLTGALEVLRGAAPLPPPTFCEGCHGVGGLLPRMREISPSRIPRPRQDAALPLAGAKEKPRSGGATSHAGSSNIPAGVPAPC